MDIDTLVQDTKALLGGSMIRLETSDEDVMRFALMAFRKIKPYVAGSKLITLPAQRTTDLTEFNILEIIRIFPSNRVSSSLDDEIFFDFQKYDRNARGSIAGKLNRSLATDYEIRFRFADNILYLNEANVYDTFITIEALVDITLEQLTDERAIAWIEKYTLALTKECIGRIRGKYKSSNLPVELDSDTMLSEASSEKQTLESELVDKDFGAFFILR